MTRREHVSFGIMRMREKLNMEISMSTEMWLKMNSEFSQFSLACDTFLIRSISANELLPPSRHSMAHIKKKRHNTRLIHGGIWQCFKLSKHQLLSIWWNIIMCLIIIYELWWCVDEKSFGVFGKLMMVKGIKKIFLKTNFMRSTHLACLVCLPRNHKLCVKNVCYVTMWRCCFAARRFVECLWTLF